MFWRYHDVWGQTLMENGRRGSHLRVHYIRIWLIITVAINIISVLIHMGVHVCTIAASMYGWYMLKWILRLCWGVAM